HSHQRLVHGRNEAQHGRSDGNDETGVAEDRVIPNATNAHAGTAASAVPAPPARSDPSESKWAKLGGGEFGLISQQNSQIAQVIPRRSGFNRIAERLKERISIKLLEGGASIQPASSGPIAGRPVGNGSRRATVSVHPVGSDTEHRDIFPRNLWHARQRELLIAAAYSAVRNLHRHFPARDQAQGRTLLSQLAQAPKQIPGSGLVIPIVARVVHMHDEARALCRVACLSNGRLVCQQGPPARALKCRMVRLRRLLESVALEQLSCRLRKLFEQILLFRDAVAILDRRRI